MRICARVTQPVRPQPGFKQVRDLLRSRDWGDAARVSALVAQPQAVWFESGSPADVTAAVHKTTMKAANRERGVPIPSAATSLQLVQLRGPAQACGRLRTRVNPSSTRTSG